MSSVGKSLCYFFMGILLLIMIMEFLVRTNQKLFEGASHKILTKALIFEKKDKVDFLFFGTSQIQDGIDPGLISHRYQEIYAAQCTKKIDLCNFKSRKKITGFNAASPGAGIDDFIFIAPRYLQQPNLRLVLIELSMPMLFNPPSLPSLLPSNQKDKLELYLEKYLHNFTFIRYRSAFQLGNLGKFFSILFFSRHMTGYESRLPDLISAWTGRTSSYPINFNENLWIPDYVKASINNKTESFDSDKKYLLIKLSMLVQLFSARNIQVVFIVPPKLNQHETIIENNNYHLLKLIASELIKFNKVQVWDFSRKLIPEFFFKDATHLNKDFGRPSWSYALASQLTRVLN